MAVLRRIVARLELLLRPSFAVADGDPRSLDGLGAAQAEALHSLGTAPPDTGRAKKRIAYLAGFSLHAAVHLHAHDREGLAHLCGYGARPAFSQERLSELPVSPGGSSAPSATAARWRCCSPLNSCVASPRWSRRRAPTSSATTACLRPPHAGAVRSSRRYASTPRQHRPARPLCRPRILRQRRLGPRPVKPLQRCGALRTHRASPGPNC